MANKWIPIKEFDNYAISERGDVKNIKTKKLLRPRLKKNKYYYYLSQNNKVHLVSLDYLYRTYIKGMNSSYLVYNRFSEFIYNAY